MEIIRNTKSRTFLASISCALILSQYFVLLEWGVNKIKTTCMKAGNNLKSVSDAKDIIKYFVIFSGFLQVNVPYNI